ncbi:hypothetical protein DFH94DRAFT_762554 [Russula ochroleuca]|uniref:CUE domain-containing protein n=1 Tax=Russula ochroleuca TaxID=152965 RepID=A0A9P5K293_9AGAM|nr:hypothetical protein DFH94DRAFT_762554 [Russula ochroleuca]
MATAALPPYPSSHALSQLSHSQLALFNQKISLCIQQILDLPPQALNSAAPVPFISSYVRDIAQNSLDALIWDTYSKPKSKPESAEARSIRARTLLLVERLASTGVLDPVTLLDLSIVYASHPTRLRTLFKTAFSSSTSILTSTTTSALPAFTSILLSHTTIGLHGLRKAAHAILCLLRVGPPDLLRAFAHSTDFMLALAQAYDAGLGAATISYGRLYIPVAGAPQRDLDDWEFLFLQTKADLLDAFHILLTALLPADPPSTTEAQRAFDIISALQALPAPARRPDEHNPPTAFLNRSLLADYQHAYNLSEELTRTLPHGAAADNARLERLSAALRELDADLDGGGSGPSATGQAHQKDPGAFRLLLGSGVPHDINDLSRGGVTRTIERPTATPFRGAEVATASSSRVIDPRVEEVRAILPDYAPEYVEALLQRSEYGSVERVVEALLEGTAPPPEALKQQVTSKAPTPQPLEEFEYTRDRRNVFDDEEMDTSRLRIGKKSDDTMTVLRDRSFMDQMKTDILRRAEAPSDSEDEEVNIFGFASDQAKRKVREIAFDDDLEDISSVRVAGDGEESSADEDEDEEPDTSPQTIIELAYIASPKVFERDAATRRSKERAALRAQSGWVDEQIEGFRIMLDRDPKMKAKMLARHEFSGNKPLTTGLPLSGPSRSRNRPPDAQPARGRGEGGRGRRGQNRGRGRGRGRGAAAGPGTGKEGGSGGGDGGDAAPNHTWKNKNKARQGNHDRKRGHDRKMGKAGAGGGPSS